MKMKYDVIVVGGGASGMFASILCAKAGKKVLVLEHKNQLGKKLLATGNGKCNYTNMHMETACFYSANEAFVAEALGQFSSRDTVEYMKNMGIYPKEKNGYVYPFSEQASAVQQVLEMEMKKWQVEVVYTHVKKIEKKEMFCVKTDQAAFCGKQVILATGGKSNEKLGADGSGYALAKQMGHRIIKPVPALIGLHCEGDWFASMAGVRMQASVGICIEDKTHIAAQETGELQLTAYGISGIPVFQVSRVAARALAEHKKVYVLIDYMPAFTQDALLTELQARFMREGQTAQEVLIGLLPMKCIPVFLGISGIKANKLATKVNPQQVQQLLGNLKKKWLVITDTNGFAQAQVTAGGVDLEEVEGATMESKLVEGLYFIGEILDVDGICGGYNLQWCWTTAFIAGEAISKKK